MFLSIVSSKCPLSESTLDDTCRECILLREKGCLYITYSNKCLKMICIVNAKRHVEELFAFYNINEC